MRTSIPVPLLPKSTSHPQCCLLPLPLHVVTLTSNTSLNHYMKKVKLRIEWWKREKRLGNIEKWEGARSNLKHRGLHKEETFRGIRARVNLFLRLRRMCTLSYLRIRESRVWRSTRGSSVWSMNSPSSVPFHLIC